MKKQLKNHLRIIILFCLVLFNSCEDSYENSTKEVSKNNFTVKEISLTNLSKDERLLKTVEKIKPKKRTAQSKIIYDPLNNFYFDDTSGKEIITVDGHKSYTFEIITDDETSNIENVLFTQNENGEYDAYRVKYNFTGEDLKTMTKDDIEKHKANYTLITSSKPNTYSKTTTKACWEVAVWEEFSYSGKEGNVDGTLDVYHGGYVAIAKVCTSTSTEIITNDQSVIVNSGWQSGDFSGSESSILGSSIYTTPVVTPGTTFIKSITPKLLREDFFNLSERVHELTFNYLNNHNFDVESQNKVRAALVKLNVFGLSQLPYNIHVKVFEYLVANNFSSSSVSSESQIIKELFSAQDTIDLEELQVCPGSFNFSDVGGNWQNAGVSDVNIQFLTIGGVIALNNIYFSQLHFGLPKSRINGDYITNTNAKYIAQIVMTEAELLTNTYQSINPKATAAQLRTFFYKKLEEGLAPFGGTISTSAPIGWGGQLKKHQTFILSQYMECD